MRAPWLPRFGCGYGMAPTAAELSDPLRAFLRWLGSWFWVVLLSLSLTSGQCQRVVVVGWARTSPLP